MSAKSWIQTFTGKQFFPLDPQPDSICIEDIAHHLSNICRFTGAVKSFYSVAEHSVRVAWRTQEIVEPLAWNVGLGIIKWALLHDAAEAYLNDLNRPTKHQPEMKAYRDAEKKVQRMIVFEFGLLPFEPNEVRQADNELLFIEARDLMSPLHPEWYGTAAHPLPEKLPNQVIQGWAPQQAEAAFLAMFSILWQR